MNFTRPWNDPLDDLLRAMNGATSTVLGYSLDGDLVATAMVGHDGHRGWVYYLAVAPDRQESGLGRMMMDACERWLIERGAVKVQLMMWCLGQAVEFFGDFLRSGLQQRNGTLGEATIHPRNGA